jgi:hypothetical protein
MKYSIFNSALFAAVAGYLVAAQKAQGPELVQGTLKIYGNDAYPVPYRKNQPVDVPRVRYPGFKPSTTILKKGSIRNEGSKVLPCDIVMERDVAVKLRDGITMLVNTKFHKRLAYTYLRYKVHRRFPPC